MDLLQDNTLYCFFTLALNKLSWLLLHVLVTTALRTSFFVHLGLKIIIKGIFIVM